MSMAIKYGMKKRLAKGGAVKPMAEGGMATSTATVDPQKAADATASMRKAFNFAKGGDAACMACKGGVCAEHGGLVDRVMAKRMSKGGMVANDTSDEMADLKENQFDDLVLRDDLEEHYTGKNSGDEIGDHAVEEDEHDLIARIMRSRAKKDRMPRPA